MKMVSDIFNGYKDENETDEISENIDAKDITRPNSNKILEHSDSDVTVAIKDSIERNSINRRDSETSFKQIFDLAMNVANELPTMVNVTGKTINKMIVKSREGIDSINNFKNSISYNFKEKSE
jgi:hypothetical protein